MIYSLLSLKVAQQENAIVWRHNFEKKGWQVFFYQIQLNISLNRRSSSSLNIKIIRFCAGADQNWVCFWWKNNFLLIFTIFSLLIFFALILTLAKFLNPCKQTKLNSIIETDFHYLLSLIRMHSSYVIKLNQLCLG